MKPRSLAYRDSFRTSKNLDSRSEQSAVSRVTASYTIEMVLQPVDCAEGLYHALPTSTHIRILSFQPLQDDILPIHCTLHLVDLDDKDVLNFQAISYTWGDPLFRLYYDKPVPPDPPVPIICNGVEVGITANLGAALEAILKQRSENADLQNDTEYLWIDSLCINQMDVQERNAQVAMMSQIYGKASRVISWLGPADKDSEIAIPLMRTLIDMNPQLNGEMEAKAHTVPAIQYGSLARFLARRYFFRCWVLQEVVLARSLRILCGTTELELNELNKAALIVGSIRQHRLYDDIGQALVIQGKGRRSFRHEMAIMAIVKHRHQRHTAGEITQLNIPSFEMLMSSTRYRSCLDPRDKIYSFLGIAPPHVFQIEPDYRKSVEEVYSEAIRLWINKTHTLDILNWVTEKSLRKFPAFPSWIGEFEISFDQQDLGSIITLHNASVGSVAVPVTLEPKSFRELHVKGVKIDHIVELAHTWQWHGAMIKYDPLWTSMTLKLPLDYPTGHRRGEALIHTLVADEIDLKPIAAHKDIDSLKEVIRKDVSYALISYLHRLCWFDLANKELSYDTAALQVLQDLETLCKTDDNGYWPSIEELRAIESITCTCNANLTQVAPDQPSTRHTSANMLCLYNSEVTFDLSYDLNDSTSPPPYMKNVVEEQGWDVNFGLSINYMMRHRRVARTRSGYLALVPTSTEVGDTLWLFPGAQEPYVLREVISDGRGDRWEVMGHSYVHGVMQGEIWKSVEGNVRDVVLV
jgi:hypothetical protein